MRSPTARLSAPQHDDAWFRLHRAPLTECLRSSRARREFGVIRLCAFSYVNQSCTWFASRSDRSVMNAVAVGRSRLPIL
jgi:hypothetical protein